MKDFRDTRIGVNDAARLLRVRTSELKAAIQEGQTLRGVSPTQRLFTTGSGGWIFRAGDVMDVAEALGYGG